MFQRFVLAMLALMFTYSPIPSAFAQVPGESEFSSLSETAQRLKNGLMEKGKSTDSVFAPPFRETQRDFLDDPFNSLKFQIPEKQPDPETPSQTVRREFVEFATSIKDWAMTGRNIWIVIAVVIAVAFVGNRLAKRS